MPKYYELNAPKSPWGDYSDILISGMSAHSERIDGLIQLERTGPYVPPISFPGIGDIIVTKAFKGELENSGLSGIRFQPVIKRHIVHLDWHLWDRSADDPDEYPEGGEPEGYILDRPHSQVVSDSMGELWELCLTESAKVHKTPRPTKFLLIESSWQGADIFRAEEMLTIYATEKAKTWFKERVAEHVVFKETLTM